MTLNDLLYEILSYTLGIDKSLVKKIRKINKFDEEEQSILENYTILEKRFSEMQDLLTDVLCIIDKQKKAMEIKIEEAKQSEVLVHLNETEVEAIEKLIERPIKRESQNSKRSSILWGALFCIIGIIGGFLIGKFLL